MPLAGHTGLCFIVKPGSLSSNTEGMWPNLPEQKLLEKQSDEICRKTCKPLGSRRHVLARYSPGEECMDRKALSAHTLSYISYARPSCPLSVSLHQDLSHALAVGRTWPAVT